MNSALEAVVLIVFVLATSVWLGGYVTIAVVARTASTTLEPAARIAFFRTLGRSFFRVGSPALVIALATGALLARDVDRGALLLATVAVAVVLLATFAVAVAQARRMTVLRHDLLTSPDDPGLVDGVRRGARAAGILRAALGVLTVVLVVLGAFLAT